MDQVIRLIIPLIVGIGGVAVGYGALRQQVKTNMKDIAEFRGGWKVLVGNAEKEPAYVRRSECDDRTKNIQAEIVSTKAKIEKQSNTIRGLENFARWTLTTKEKLTIIEVNKILNGGDE